ncbi:MAG: hypothetical protein KC416_00730 [Myxococcales bacterium]|nr:hypothetical protein [Myxococcales bacterium]
MISKASLSFARHLMAVLALGALSACDDDGDGKTQKTPGTIDGGADGGDPVSTTFAAYCAERSRLYFDFLQHCYGEEHYSEEYRKEYVPEITDRCQKAQGALDDGRLIYDGEQATRCLASIDPMDCSTAFLSDDCNGIFTGTSNPGDDCYREETQVFLVGTSTCKGGLCIEEENMCPGTCTALPARGEGCLSGQCGPEDYCDEETDKCVARKGAGEDCPRGYECTTGTLCTGEPGAGKCLAVAKDKTEACGTTTVCGGPSACVDGTCKSRSELGEACALSSNCPANAVCKDKVCAALVGVGGSCTINTHCKADHLCDDDTEKCVALPGKDEPCLKNRCSPGDYCRFDTEKDGPNGTCRALVTEGNDCLANGLPDTEACVDGVFCVETGTCEAPGKVNEPCNVFDERTCEAGLWCSRATKTCVAPAAKDAPCNPYWWTRACQPGLGCACSLKNTDSCNSIDRFPTEFDTCQPLGEAGADCFRQGECKTGQCTIDFEAPKTTPGKCEAEPMECLPE